MEKLCEGVSYYIILPAKTGARLCVSSRAEARCPSGFGRLVAFFAFVGEHFFSGGRPYAAENSSVAAARAEISEQNAAEREESKRPARRWRHRNDMSQFHKRVTILPPIQTKRSPVALSKSISFMFRSAFS
jgi:hypothetical protein